MKRKDWPVGEYGVRPAGEPDECFYCHAKVGEQHGLSCVVRSRTVLVRVTTEIVIDVPEDWDKEQIEAAKNQGSWCADNILSIMEARNERTGGCLCGKTKIEFVRDATEDDEDGDQIFVNDLPT